MEFSALLGLIALIFVIGANLLLAFVVFVNNRKSATNILFCLLSVVISIWILTNYLSLDSTVVGGTLLWTRLTLFWATPMSFLFFLLADILPKNTFTINRKRFWLMASLTAIVMLVTLSPFAFTKAEIVNGSVSPVPGPGMLPFTLLSTFYSVAAVYILRKRMRLSMGFEKEQFRYVMYGILLMLGLIIVTILLPAIFLKVTTFVPFIPLYTLIFLGMTNYAIIRHKLLDIRLFVARSLAYTLVVTIAGTAYTAAIFLVSQYFFRRDITTVQALVYALIALFVAFTFQRLKNSLEEITDKLFFK